MSTQADRLTKLTSQLVGDIGQLQGVMLDSATEQQLVQLLTDAFEEVGLVALNAADELLLGPKDLKEGQCALVSCAISYPHFHPANPPANA